MRHNLLFLCLLALFAVTAYTQVAPQNTIVTYPSLLVAGTPGQIYFQERTATNTTITLSTCAGITSPFSVQVISGPPGGASRTSFTNLVCYQNKANSFSVSINTQVAGTYVLQAFYNTNTAISSSVSTLVTVPSVMSAQFSYMTGRGLQYALVGQNTTFNIQAVDQYGNTISNCSDIQQNQFSIKLFQPTVFEEVTGVIGPCTNGRFTPSYVVNVTGNWLLVVNYIGNQLNNTQPQVLAEPGPPVASQCTVSGPGMVGAQAGQLTWFNFTCHDGYGNLITYCDTEYINLWTPLFTSTSPPGRSFNAVFESCNNQTGVLNYTYQQYSAANYTSDVYFNGMQSNHLPTFYPVISPGPPDPDRTVATGNGVMNTTQNVAGQLIKFTIDESDQYGNPIPGCISANWQIDIVPQPNVPAGTPYCDGVNLASNYTTNTAGSYQVEIYLNGTLINNQEPYTAIVYSNLLVPAKATAQFTKTISAGDSGTFSIKGFDTYNNDFNNCDLYPPVSGTFSGWTVTLVNAQNPSIVGSGSISSCSYQGVIGMLNGQYTASVAGTYNLTISYNGVSIQNPAPGIVVVSAGSIVVPFSVANGTGFLTQYNATQAAGVQGHFDIQSYDKYGNRILVCQSTSFSWNVNFLLQGTVVKTIQSTFVDCVEPGGVYGVNFNLLQTGQYTINVTTNSIGPTQRINNTGMVTIVPTTYDPLRSQVNATATGSVGQTFLVNTTAYDLFGNPINFDRSLNLSFSALSLNTTYNGTLQYLSGNTYQGSFVPIVEGTYIITVFTNLGLPIGFAQSVVIYGEFSTTYSTANGTAFYLNVTAGLFGKFQVQTFNQYGFMIPAFIVNVNMFNVTFENEGQYYLWPYYIDNSVYVNAVAFEFNATKALNYTIMIYYNNIATTGNHSSNVVAAALDPNTLVINQLPVTSDGLGNFTVTGTDRWNNSVDLGANVVPKFEPSCSYSNVTCYPNPVGDELFCNFNASFAGTYCVEIYYAPQQAYYPTSKSTVVVGGTGCSKNCGNNGYCFPQSDSDLQNTTTGDCFCFQGYTGDDCSVKISKKYWNLWLGVGLIVGIPIILAILGFVVGCLIGRR